MNLFDLVTQKTKDTSGSLAFDDVTSNINESLKRYSKARPRIIPGDVAGNGTHDLELPDCWSEGFSSIHSIEYPVGRVPEVLLERDLYTEYLSPAGKKLRILSATPAADEAVRVLYSTLHTEETVPVADTEAVANLAASLCCEQLANIHAQTSDPTIQADVVSYRTKSSEFAGRAKALKKLYDDHVGIQDDSVAAAAVTVSHNTYPRESGRLTHRRR